MQRDPNLCRAILHALERSTNHGLSRDLLRFDEVVAITSDENLIGYHCAILIDAGLIVGLEKGWDTSPYACDIHRLTWDGHEFLDASRDEGQWAQVRDAAKGLRTWTFAAIAWHKNWARTEIETGMTPAEKKKERNATPIEDKESIRWIEGLREALNVARVCPNTRCILIGDSEADIYELLSEPRDTGHNRPLEILIRGCQERATTESGRSILEHARTTPCLYTATVNVSPRKAKTKVETQKRASERPARVANVEVRACKTTL